MDFPTFKNYAPVVFKGASALGNLKIKSSFIHPYVASVEHQNNVSLQWKSMGGYQHSSKKKCLCSAEERESQVWIHMRVNKWLLLYKTYWSEVQKRQHASDKALLLMWVLNYANKDFCCNTGRVSTGTDLVSVFFFTGRWYDGLTAHLQPIPLLRLLSGLSPTGDARLILPQYCHICICCLCIFSWHISLTLSFSFSLILWRKGLIKAILGMRADLGDVYQLQ